MDRRPLLDRLLNTITLIAAFILFVLAVNSVAGRVVPVYVGLAQGEAVLLRDTDWNRNGHTLIFALQPNCSYTEASLDFYKDILASLPRGIQPVLVTPHPVPVGRQMAVEYGLNLRDVRMASFRSINVPGSPTLIFADEKGRVLKAWIGKVSPDGEREVFHVLGISRVTHGAGPAGATSPKSEVAVAVPADEFVVDVRDPDEARRWPVIGARSIPIDELEARLLHEAPNNERVFALCDYCVNCDFAGQRILPSRCDVTSHLMETLGYHQVRMVGYTDLLSETGGADGR